MESGASRRPSDEIFWRADGTPLHVRYTGNSIADAAGAQGAVITFHDITERKRFEEKMREARRQAERASRAKSEFLATMSHEIRTPMNGVLGMAEVLGHSTLDEDQRSCLDTIQESGRALLVSLDDILDFSKIESGNLELEAIAFDVVRAARDVEQLLLPTAHGKGVRLSLTIDDECPRHVVSDAGRFRQIMLNLVSNAVKFTKEGAVQMRLLRLDGDASKARLRFEVEDTGIGIPEAQQGHLFQVFSQADASTTRRFGGTGLGLAISRRLIESMGGQIGVESCEGCGSTFWVEVSLPIAELPQSGRMKTVALEAPRFGGRVLVVEDNAVNRRVAIRMLEMLGVEAETAEDGEAAVQRCLDDTFDLILMDCQMPKMDGYEATRAIRGHEGHNRRIPVVALTANAMAEDQARCNAAGMDDFIAKPYSRADLMRVLERWLPSAPAVEVDATSTPAPDSVVRVRPPRARRRGGGPSLVSVAMRFDSMKRGS